MIFEDFELTISAAEASVNGANVIVRYAKGIRMGAFSLSSVVDVVTELNAAMQQAQPLQNVMERCGGALFAALFTGNVLDAWRESWTLAQQQQHGVRLRLFSETPAIMAVPWEYLYDRNQQHFLALDSDCSLVRTLPLSGSEPLQVVDTLRVLVMLSNPKGLTHLDSVREWAQLQAIADTAAIELIPVEPTYAALLAALRQGPHVFHFVGHGGFGANFIQDISDRRHLRPTATANEALEQGVLFFCDENGAPELISADKLATLLSGCKTLRLALLNACQGANTGTRSAFAGVAQRLIQQAVPAVLAMQAPIYDDHAVRFSQEFYQALADGMSVEEAVGQGRKRINEVTYSWGIPTLYFQGKEPFAIPPLSDADKAARLWQKAQRISAADPPAQRRTLLETVLKLDPTHAAAHHALEQLMNAEEAARLYTVSLTYHANQQWREAHRALEQVERLASNFRNTRSLLAEVLGKLDNVAPVLPPGYTEQQRLYQPLLNALLEGRLVPFLGGDVSRVGRPSQDGWVRGQYLPGADEVAQFLVGRLSSQLEGAPSLLQVSQYTTLLEGETVLYERLNELYADHYPPTTLHQLLAELPGRLRAKDYPMNVDRRFVIFSTAFDDMLERAFDAVGQPYHIFAYRHRFVDANGSVQHGRFLHLPPGSEPIELLTPNTYNGHDGDRHPVIVKLCGQRVTLEPDSVVITEDHYLDYLPAQEIGALLPMTLLNQVKRRSFVFFGYNLQPWHARLLWQRMRYQKSRLHDKGWAIVANPTELEQEFWRSYAITPLTAAPEGVVAYINQWLEQLAVRGSTL